MCNVFAGSVVARLLGTGMVPKNLSRLSSISILRMRLRLVDPCIPSTSEIAEAKAYNAMKRSTLFVKLDSAFSSSVPQYGFTGIITQECPV